MCAIGERVRVKVGGDVGKIERVLDGGPVAKLVPTLGPILILRLEAPDRYGHTLTTAWADEVEPCNT